MAQLYSQIYLAIELSYIVVLYSHRRYSYIRYPIFRVFSRLYIARNIWKLQIARYFWLYKSLLCSHIYPYIDHFQSMTIFFVIDHGQWQFFCHWPGSMTLFWALSISFCHWLWSMTYGHKWYVHKVEWFSALSNIQWEQGCQKIVSDQSMTIFCDYQFLMEAKIVIDRSMTF